VRHDTEGGMSDTSPLTTQQGSRRRPRPRGRGDTSTSAGRVCFSSPVKSQFLRRPSDPAYLCDLQQSLTQDTAHSGCLASCTPPPPVTLLRDPRNLPPAALPTPQAPPRGSNSGRRGAYRGFPEFQRGTSTASVCSEFTRLC